MLVALSYPRFLVTSDPSNGLGSGLTRGLVRVHAYSGTLLASDPFLCSGPKARGHGKWTLSKTRHTVKNPRPSGYGVFALQHDQSLFPSHHKPCNLSVGVDQIVSPDPGNGRGSGLIRESRYEYLVSMNIFLQMTLPYTKLRGENHGNKPCGYRTFAHQCDQSLSPVPRTL
jgi:hypothetical protein